jgi:DNA helicase MCM8
VKLALMLALLGGSSPPPDSSNVCSTVRSNIHVMLIGDPGLGKSQLLHACVAASPRGMYVCSNSSTTAGLTLSVTRDAVTNEMAFTAGALVLADGGVCCLDELDNMKGEHKTLLEVMEQQEV